MMIRANEKNSTHPHKRMGLQILTKLEQRAARKMSEDNLFEPRMINVVRSQPDERINGEAKIKDLEVKEFSKNEERVMDLAIDVSNNYENQKKESMIIDNHCISKGKGDCNLIKENKENNNDNVVTNSTFNKTHQDDMKKKHKKKSSCFLFTCFGK